MVFSTHGNALTPSLTSGDRRPQHISFARELTYALVVAFYTQAKQSFLQAVLGDSIVIWRAWVAWDRQLPVVLVPDILLVGVGRTI